MENKFKRSLIHLQDKNTHEFIIEAIQAVENLFSEIWLKEMSGHRLQILWGRRDSLATTELFFLGKAILKLSTDNRRWLESTARDIKKDAASSHGLITEIITIGALSTDGGLIKPCPQSNPIYDYEIEFETGYKHKVSIKNFDITIHEKAFQKRSEIIRKTFKNFLERSRSSGRMHVLLEHHILTDDLMLEICCRIVFSFKEHGNYPGKNNSYHLFYYPINDFESEALHPVSDIVQITARQHYNENRNITDKIDKANKQLLSDPQNPKEIKQLIIRLGASADFDIICRHIDKISDDWEFRGFDFIQVYQPQVVDDIKCNKSSICTSVYFGDKLFYPDSSSMVEKIKNTRIVKMEFAAGSISFKSIPMSFENNGIPTGLTLNSFYNFQQGDVYLKSKLMEGARYEGTMSRVYPGVVTHLVIKDMTISPIVYTKEERLLII